VSRSLFFICLLLIGRADVNKALDNDDDDEDEDGDDYVPEELEDDEDDVNEDADYVDGLNNGVGYSCWSAAAVVVLARVLVLSARATSHNYSYPSNTQSLAGF